MAIWSYHITQEALDITKPDVVLWEVTERYLNAMDKYSEEFTRCSINYDKNARLNILYYDYGKYSKLWSPVWSEENGQDDLEWYEAERIDDWTWHLSIELDENNTDSVYNIHFYEGDGSRDEAQWIFSQRYDINSGDVLTN